VADDFGLIAVVSHVPDFSDRMASQLLVSMEDGESYAVLA
jgi:DNA repair exonuclease SbcCD ATPase subunit